MKTPNEPSRSTSPGDTWAMFARRLAGRRNVVRWFLLSVWVWGLCSGVYLFTRHTWTPAEHLAIREEWPEQVPRTSPAGCEVLVFVHPRCPCTLATLENLSTAVRDSQVCVTCICYIPTKAEGAWFTSPSVQRIRNWAGARLIWDLDGHIAQSFGAAASGECRIYRPSGTLAFAGGVTPGRGHVGDCRALREFARALNQVETEGEKPTIVPTFGCTIQRVERLRATVAPVKLATPARAADVESRSISLRQEDTGMLLGDRPPMAPPAAPSSVPDAPDPLVRRRQAANHLQLPHLLGMGIDNTLTLGR